MPSTNTARHNISRAGTIFQGSVSYGNYNGGKAGVELSYTYFWRPTGSQPITFTGALSGNASSATLNANWAPPSGLYPITLSNGLQFLGYFVQGQTAVLFYDSLNPGGGIPEIGTTITPATANAVVSQVPPIVGTGTQIAASQGVGAGALFLLNGTYLNNIPGSSAQVIGGVAYAGVILPDVPRNVVGAWTTASTVTVSGFDVYGQATTETQTGTTFTGKKAFAVITSIKSSAAITAATFGFGNALGLPFLTTSGNWFGALFNDAGDAGTFVQGDLTSPATSATGDPRGTYTPAGTLNGAKFINSEVKVFDTSSQIGTFGMQPA